jgi:hypothetical protein
MVIMVDHFVNVPIAGFLAVGSKPQALWVVQGVLGMKEQTEGK